MRGVPPSPVTVHEPARMCPRNSATVAAGGVSVNALAEKFAAMVVGAADEDLPPWLRVSGREIVAIRQFIDLLGREGAQNLPRRGRSAACRATR